MKNNKKNIERVRAVSTKKLKILGIPVYTKSRKARALPMEKRSEIAREMCVEIREWLRKEGIWEGSIEHVRPYYTNSKIGVILEPRPATRKNQKGMSEVSLDYLYQLTKPRAGYLGTDIVNAAKKRADKRGVSTIRLQDKLKEMKKLRNGAGIEHRNNVFHQQTLGADGKIKTGKTSYGEVKNGNPYYYSHDIYVGKDDYAGMAKDVKIPIGYVWSATYREDPVQRMERLKSQIVEKKTMNPLKQESYSPEKTIELLKQDARWKAMEGAMKKRNPGREISDRAIAVMVLGKKGYIAGSFKNADQKQREKILAEGMEDYWADMQAQVRHEKPKGAEQKVEQKIKRMKTMHRRLIYRVEHKSNWFYISAYNPGAKRSNKFEKIMMSVFRKWNNKRVKGQKYFRYYTIAYSHWGLEERFYVDKKYGKYLLIYLRM